MADVGRPPEPGRRQAALPPSQQHQQHRYSGLQPSYQNRAGRQFGDKWEGGARSAGSG